MSLCSKILFQSFLDHKTFSSDIPTASFCVLLRLEGFNPLFPLQRPVTRDLRVRINAAFFLRRCVLAFHRIFTKRRNKWKSARGVIARLRRASWSGSSRKPTGFHDVRRSVRQKVIGILLKIVTFYYLKRFKFFLHKSSDIVTVYN